jgi:uncharacterized protein YwgA
MERSFARVILLLNSLTKPSIQSFNDRMKLQKLVFLARQVGFDTGFSFSWYIHGPYSPSLTNFLYTVNDVGILETAPTIPEDEKRRLDASVILLRRLLGDDLNKPKVLELIASVWYVLPQGPVSRERKESLAKMLNQLKPDFSIKEYAAAADRILEFREKELRSS